LYIHEQYLSIGHIAKISTTTGVGFLHTADSRNAGLIYNTPQKQTLNIVNTPIKQYSTV